MTLRGNIDQVEFLRTRHAAQIKQRVRELLEQGKAARKLGSLHHGLSLSTAMPYENMHAFAEAGREFGRYA